MEGGEAEAQMENAGEGAPPGDIALPAGQLDGEQAETFDWDFALRPIFDWDAIQIEEKHDEEGKTEIATEEHLYALLGLKDEDEMADKAREEARAASGRTKVDASAYVFPNVEGTEGAAIPVHDSIPGEDIVFCDKNNPVMEVGCRYRSMKEFRVAMRQYALNKQFELKVDATDPTRYRGSCRDEDCPWSIHARPERIGSDTIMVIVLNDVHTCTSSARRRTTTPTTEWVADKALPILRKNPHMRPVKLQKRLQDDHKCIINYDTVWRGRERALEELYGTWEDSFQLLYNWKAEVLKRSPNSVIEIGTKVVEGKVYFNKFFCALGPCIEGFLDGCRPYLSIDSTALNGRWKGHLPSACSVDGHNWMYPVAFGFFDSETEENWTWFMAQLHKAIGDLPTLAICTDACKGLINAVDSVFPHAEKRECFRHLIENYIKKYRGAEHMFPAARAYKKQVYDHHMSEILSDPEISFYLGEYHKLKWMRSQFNPAIKCDYITNNVAESFNNWIKELKDLPVCELADNVREMIMVLHYKRRKIGEKLQGRILPAITHILNARTRGVGHLTVVKGDHHVAEIWDNTNCHDRHVVKARKHECSCEEWQHTGKPCPHALCLITAQQIRNVKMEDFVNEYYSVEKFKNAYKRLVEPLPDRSQWPKVDMPFKVEAPLEKRNVGRQRKLRFKSCLEGGGKRKTNHKDSEKAKKMIRGQVTCPKCGGLGHRRNSPKCPFNGPKKRKRKPRKNSTKGWFPKEVPTNDGIVAENTSEALMLRGGTSSQPASMITSTLSDIVVMGEGTSSQPPTMVTLTPTKQLIKKRCVKKITPKKLKKA